jgi:hypothetical protein
MPLRSTKDIEHIFILYSISSRMDLPDRVEEILKKCDAAEQRFYAWCDRTEAGFYEGCDRLEERLSQKGDELERWLEESPDHDRRYPVFGATFGAGAGMIIGALDKFAHGVATRQISQVPHTGMIVKANQFLEGKYLDPAGMPVGYGAIGALIGGAILLYIKAKQMLE